MNKRLTSREIGKTMSAWLKENGITHEMAAERLGYSSKQCVSNILSGRRISLKTAERFSSEFGFSILFMIAGRGDLFQNEEDMDRSEMQKIIRSQQMTIESLIRQMELMGGHRDGKEEGR